MMKKFVKLFFFLNCLSAKGRYRGREYKKGEISVWFRGVLIAQIHSTTIERILNFKRFDAFAIGGN